MAVKVGMGRSGLRDLAMEARVGEWGGEDSGLAVPELTERLVLSFDQAELENPVPRREVCVVLMELMSISAAWREAAWPSLSCFLFASSSERISCICRRAAVFLFHRDFVHSGRRSLAKLPICLSFDFKSSPIQYGRM